MLPGRYAAALRLYTAVPPFSAADAYAAAEAALARALALAPDVFYLLAQQTEPPGWHAAAELAAVAALPPAERAATVAALVASAAWRAAPGARAWLLTAGAAAPATARASVYHKCGRATCLRSGPAAALKRCTGCRAVFFCSAACYTAAWPAHKADCARLKAVATAGDAVDKEVAAVALPAASA